MWKRTGTRLGFWEQARLGPPLLLALLLCATEPGAGLSVVHAQTLSPQAQYDLLRRELLHYVREGNHAKVVETIGRMRKSGARVSPSLYYFEGKAYLQLKQPNKAIAALTQYVNTVGSSGKFYTKALDEMVAARAMKEVVDKKRAEADARAAAAERSRKAELARRQAAAAKQERARREAARVKQGALASQARLLRRLVAVVDVNALSGTAGSDFSYRNNSQVTIRYKTVVQFTTACVLSFRKWRISAYRDEKRSRYTGGSIAIANLKIGRVQCRGKYHRYCDLGFGHVSDRDWLRQTTRTRRRGFDRTRSKSDDYELGYFQPATAARFRTRMVQLRTYCRLKRQVPLSQSQLKDAAAVVRAAEAANPSRALRSR